MCSIPGTSPPSSLSPLSLSLSDSHLICHWENCLPVLNSEFPSVEYRLWEVLGNHLPSIQVNSFTSMKSVYRNKFLLMIQFIFFLFFLPFFRFLSHFFPSSIKVPFSPISVFNRCLLFLTSSVIPIVLLIIRQLTSTSIWKATTITS